MKRQRQSVEDLLASLSALPVSWQDPHALAVIQSLGSIPESQASREDIVALLRANFRVGLTIVQLALDLSKDEIEARLRGVLGAGGAGSKRFHAEPTVFVNALIHLGLLEKLAELTAKPVTWRDILIERLKAGRGSAIKGQVRGRQLEDFTQRIVERVFHDIGFTPRCRFVGSKGLSTEKADFAIPSKDDPCILIEAKAFGATGSKQTDILGDIARIVDQKRHDTDLLLVTDGETWMARVNDLRKLVALQNEGKITRIYTQRMASELEDDLLQLRRDHDL